MSTNKQIIDKRTTLSIHKSVLDLLENERKKGESKELLIMRLLSFSRLIKKLEAQIKKLQEENQVDEKVKQLRQEVLDALSMMEQADIEG